MAPHRACRRNQRRLQHARISTPHAAAWPALGNSAASASVAIIETLSRIGAAEAAAIRCIALRMPPHSVTRVMSRR